jgi:hypothetical protein
LSDVPEGPDADLRPIGLGEGSSSSHEANCLRKTTIAVRDFSFNPRQALAKLT